MKLITMTNFRLIKRNNLNTEKWDSCIEQSTYGLPYALSFYLDAVAENWAGLVCGDYSSVMPLVWMNKVGVKLLYQPYYCQQLGVFSDSESMEVDVHSSCLKEAKKYAYVNIQLHSGAKCVEQEFDLKPRKNLLLPLNETFKNLQEQFSDNHLRNINKAKKSNLHFRENSDLMSFKKFYLGNINRQAENFKTKHEVVFNRLLHQLWTHNSCRIFSVENSEKQLLAAVLLVPFKRRLCAIVNTSSVEGKRLGASHFIFNEIIRYYADKDLVLDFEGSSIPGIARFYQGFGASIETYFLLKTHWLKGSKTRF